MKKEVPGSLPPLLFLSLYRRRRRGENRVTCDLPKAVGGKRRKWIPPHRLSSSSSSLILACHTHSSPFIHIPLSPLLLLPFQTHPRIHESWEKRRRRRRGYIQSNGAGMRFATGKETIPNKEAQVFFAKICRTKTRACFRQKVFKSRQIRLQTFPPSEEEAAGLFPSKEP